MTHEYYYQAKRAGVVNNEYESFFAENSLRLAGKIRGYLNLEYPIIR